MRRIVLLAVLGAAIAAAAWFAAMRSGAPAAIALRPDDAEFVAQGRAIYDQHCAVCHGANLEGQPDWRTRDAAGLLPAPPHDETGHTWHHSDDVLFEVTKYGLERFAGPDYETAMPAYESVLSDEEILAVLSYIKSTWPADIQALQAQRNRAD